MIIYIQLNLNELFDYFAFNAKLYSRELYIYILRIFV